MDGYVLPGHDHVFEQQAHDLPARVKVGLGGVEAGGHLRAERLDRGQRWGQLRARLPLLLKLRHLCVALSMLSRQLPAPGRQLVEADHPLLIGVQQALLLATVPHRELLQPRQLLLQHAIFHARTVTDAAELGGETVRREQQVAHLRPDRRVEPVGPDPAGTAALQPARRHRALPLARIVGVLVAFARRVGLAALEGCVRTQTTG